MPEEPFSGNALEWAVRRVDQNLDKVEENPPAAAKAVWSAARSPVGTATARGVTTAAKVTVEIGAQALKATPPPPPPRPSLHLSLFPTPSSKNGSLPSLWPYEQNC